MLYPLKFRPRLVEKIWGGRKLATLFGKTLPPVQSIGESWELYDFPPGVIDGSRDWVSAEISEGPSAGRTLHQLMAERGPELLGRTNPSGPDRQFPVLIKFLDAAQDLSVQVHPDGAYAAANPGSHLKTEAWYVLHADAGARILHGLAPGAGRPELERAIERNDVEPVLRSVPAKAGDCFYLPSGTVHALGAGLLVAEVQTPSDTTFRLFDFGRIDPATGAPRSLHVREALQCIDFAAGAPMESSSTSSDRLVDSPFFALHQSRLQPGSRRTLEFQSALPLILIEGSAVIRSASVVPEVRLRAGELALLPAALQKAEIVTDAGCAWLSVNLPERSGR